MESRWGKNGNVNKVQGIRLIMQFGRIREAENYVCSFTTVEYFIIKCQKCGFCKQLLFFGTNFLKVHLRFRFVKRKRFCSMEFRYFQRFVSGQSKLLRESKLYALKYTTVFK